MTLDFPTRPECQTEALLDSVRLPDSPTVLTVWRPNRAYGTPELIDALQIAAQEMEWMLPEAEPIVVGDLSTKRGGLLSGHRSHRGGLDADIGLYYTEERPYQQGFVAAGPERFDAEANWLLIRSLLNTGLVERILLDQRLINVLRKYVVQSGELTVEESLEIFPNVDVPWLLSGVVHHVAGHHHHMHVRVHCYEESTW